MKILVTSFDAFGGETVNPADLAVQALAETIEGAEIIKLRVPTIFGQASDLLAGQLKKTPVEAVLCIGQAGGRPGLTLERVALNIEDAGICDNAGQQPIDQVIQPDGPTAYLTTLPIKAMVQAIRQAGLPAQVSNTAGTFVCNHLMYQALYLADRYYPGMRAGFMHIPYLPCQVLDKPGQASMNLADIVRAIEVAIASILTHDQDIALVEGQLH